MSLQELSLSISRLPSSGVGTAVDNDQMALVTISWTAKPLRIDLNTLFAWFPEPQASADDMSSKVANEPEDPPPAH
ncbi:hypothetical protein GSI_05528 [Ganoderma sinense ZZ0214-1]|uniref:Uncharacterized protein n=1 Tax=Ganoderma sinense ZZ0214-1 TaxID=1077348 RepID=A0A2G8SEV2_9APHY|nr:hypothetical protein GSI_05528 [Ganoderma sinense ZZ0214-1]